MATENAYPPLQFVDPKTGAAIGWEYDAMAEMAKRLNFTPVIVNMSWDAMIPAVSEAQVDIGMTGITIRDDRKEKVDFSDAYMHSEMRMLVRADEDRFTDAASFAALEGGLIAAQPGTTPFYTAVYEVLDGDEANPRIKGVETFGAGVQALLSGDVDLVLSDGVAGAGLRRRQRRQAQDRRRAARRRGLRLHLPEGLRPRRPDQRRHRRDAGRRHPRRAEQQVVRRLPDGAVGPGRPPAPARPRGRVSLVAGRGGADRRRAPRLDPDDPVYGRILALALSRASASPSS